jgi:CheY-like chemotaxis protein
MKVNRQTAGSYPSFAQIVAGLSHHLNNPLAAILGYSDLLLRRDLDGGTKGMLELIHQEAERCKRTLESLSEMTRAPGSEFLSVDLRALAEECVAIKTSEFDAQQVHVQLDFPAAGLVSRVDPIGFKQLLFHLLDNALQALEGQTKDKTLSISGRNVNGWVEVHVKDNGSGIKPDVLPRIFEPFYTTKSKEQSAGLGLTISLAILQDHEGRIEVDSTEEHGTSVTIFVPEKAKPSRTASIASTVLVGKKILVAEDEPALAQLLSSLLTPLKAEVVHVNNGLEALASAQQGQWDLIISDIQMPGISGIELHQRLASSSPDLAKRMILITGSTRAQPETSLQQGPKAQFLYKPFSRSQLIDAISRVFAEFPSVPSA